MDKTCEEWFDEVAHELKRTNQRKYRRLRAAYNDMVGRANSSRPGVLKALEHDEDILASIKFGPVESALALATMSPVIVLENSSAPPSAFWLELLTPATLAQDFLANMEEVFIDRWVPRYGVRKARLIWISQCLQMLIGYWGTLALRLFDEFRLKR